MVSEERREGNSWPAACDAMGMQRLFLLMAIYVLSLSGCAGLVHKQSTGLYENSRQQTAMLYGSEMIYPKFFCDKQAVITDPADPRKYEQCLEPISTKADIEISAKTKDCLGMPDTNQCVQELNAISEKYAAQMTLRYKFADANWATMKCKAEGGCKNLIDYETYLNLSHNEALRAAWNKAMASDNDAYLKNYQAETANNPFAHMGDGLINAGRNSTHCTTTGGGGVYNTNCY